MADQYTVTTRESWGSRIGNAFSGVLIGLLMFVGSFPLLWWNEGRAIQTAQSLEEGLAAVVAIDADDVNVSNNGKLIHVTADALTDEQLSDPIFGIQAQALRLRRTVEMYQWRENKESDSQAELGGGSKTVTTYTYEKVWSERLISSADFYDAAGHANPARMAFESETFDAKQVALGAFALPSSLLQQIDPSETLPVDAIPTGLAISDQFPVRAHAGEIYMGDNPAEAAIGDMRVRYATAPNQTVSIIAQQQGQTFSAYQTRAGDALAMLQTGVHSADGMFAVAQQQNRIFTWVLRVVGFLLMMIGLILIFRVIRVIGDVVPFIGSLIGTGTAILAGLFSLAGSSTTIAIAWLFYRPMISVPLLILAAGAVVWMVKRMRAERVVAQTEAA